MNGQPTAQNTRECGANGDFPRSATGTTRNTSPSSARLWNVEPVDDPALDAADPRDADLPLRRDRLDPAACGSSAPTRPCRMPELARIRKILAKRGPVRRRAGRLPDRDGGAADVVLPAALWGEKTGCFTNADRTVHLSHKAVEPPGEARPTSTSSSTTPGGWTSATRTASR